MSTISKQQAPRPSDRTRDAAFFALMADAFGTSLITEANEFMDDGESAWARHDRELVPAYVPQHPRAR